MKSIKRILATLVLCFVLGMVLVSPAMAEDEGVTVRDPNGNDVTADNHQDSEEEGNSVTNSDGKLDADEIYSDEYILGFPRGEGKAEELAKPSSWLGVISASDVLWAIICLVCAIIGAWDLLSFIATHLLNLGKIGAAGLDDDADKASERVRKAKKSSKEVATGAVYIGLILAGTIFLLSLF